MRPRTATVLILRPPITGRAEPLAFPSTLSAAELSRAASFKFASDATRWAHWRAALREILATTLGIPPSAVPLEATPSGKPFLRPPHGWLHFNLSHCKELALVALATDGPVGIDVESTSRAIDLPECATSFCHPHELATTLPPESLLDLWTAKEALLKSLGTGLTHPPTAVHILPPEAPGAPRTATSDTPLPGIESIRIHRLHHPDLAHFSAAIALPQTTDSIHFASHPGFPASSDSRS